MDQLQITIIQEKNLKKQDWFSDNDAYVKIYLDDKKQNSKHPQWNQTFLLDESFLFNKIKLFNHFHGQDILHLDVYDKDLIIDDKIGSTQIDLYEKAFSFVLFVKEI